MPPKQKKQKKNNGSDRSKRKTAKKAPAKDKLQKKKSVSVETRKTKDPTVGKKSATDLTNLLASLSSQDRANLWAMLSSAPQSEETQKKSGVTGEAQLSDATEEEEGVDTEEEEEEVDAGEETEKEEEEESVEEESASDRSVQKEKARKARKKLRQLVQKRGRSSSSSSSSSGRSSSASSSASSYSSRRNSKAMRTFRSYRKSAVAFVKSRHSEPFLKQVLTENTAIIDKIAFERLRAIPELSAQLRRMSIDTLRRHAKHWTPLEAAVYAAARRQQCHEDGTPLPLLAKMCWLLSRRKESLHMLEPSDVKRDTEPPGSFLLTEIGRVLHQPQNSHNAYSSAPLQWQQMPQVPTTVATAQVTPAATVAQPQPGNMANPAAVLALPKVTVDGKPHTSVWFQKLKQAGACSHCLRKGHIRAACPVKAAGFPEGV